MDGGTLDRYLHDDEASWLAVKRAPLPADQDEPAAAAGEWCARCQQMMAYDQTGYHYVCGSCGRIEHVQNNPLESNAPAAASTVRVSHSGHVYVSSVGQTDIRAQVGAIMRDVNERLVIKMHPDVMDQVINIVHSLRNPDPDKKFLFRGDSLMSKVAAAMMLVFRAQNTIISEAEVVAACRIPARKLTNGYKRIVSAQVAGHIPSPHEDDPSPRLLGLILSRLKMMRFIELAEQLVELDRRSGVSRHTDSRCAGAVWYLIQRRRGQPGAPPTTLEQMTEISNVSSATFIAVANSIAAAVKALDS